MIQILAHSNTYVLGCGNFHGLLDTAVVRPQVFVPVSRGHGGAGAFGAELGQTAEEKGNLLEELYGFDREPFVEVFALGQFDGHAEVPDLKGVLRDFLQTRAPLVPFD